MTDEPADAPIEVETHVTAADVPLLNQRYIEALSTTARKIGSGLMVVGGLGLAAWVWIAWRTIEALNRDEPDDFSSVPVFVGGNGDPGAADYADALSQTSTLLLFAALVVGVGVIVRVLAAHVGNAAGADVSDLPVGSPIDA